MATAVALAAIMASSSAMTWTQNDAGSGSDASADVSSATQLPRLGAYVGNFTPTDTMDAYYYKASQTKGPACTTATVQSDLAVRLHLGAVSRGVVQQIEASSLPGQRLGLAVATDGFKGAYLGAELDTIPTVMPIRYDFSLESRRAADMGAGDAGQAGDASGGLGEATAISAGACYAGRFGVQDTADTYRLPLATATTLLFTFASEADGATLQLRNAAGDVIASLPSGQSLPIGLPVGDTFVTITTSSVQTNGVYSFAAGGVGSGPPQEPCEPACMALME